MIRTLIDCYVLKSFRIIGRYSLYHNYIQFVVVLAWIVELHLKDTRQLFLGIVYSRVV